MTCTLVGHATWLRVCFTRCTDTDTDADADTESDTDTDTDTDDDMISHVIMLQKLPFQRPAAVSLC